MQLAAKLDRETKDSYTVGISITDTAGFRDSVKMTVSVADDNDNAPVFAQASYFGTAIEDAKAGTAVVSNISASDADVGSNAKLEFKITKGNSNNAFDLKVTDGKVSVVVKDSTPLDFEGKPQYQILLFPFFLPHFRLHEVASLHMCVLPFKYRKILEMLLKLMTSCLALKASASTRLYLKPGTAPQTQARARYGAFT